MKAWTYQPSAALHQSLGEQLTVFPRERDMSWTLARLLWTITLRAFLRAYFRLGIHGRERLPRTGGFVIAANHASHLDAVALSCLSPLHRVDRLFAAAAKDYFFASFWRALFSAVFINALPFSRTKESRESLELCADLLAVSDNVLIMFPEGTRSLTGSIQPFKRGIGELVAGTERAVLPVYIQGAFKAWPKGSSLPRPRRVRIFVGEPLDFRDTERSREGFAQVAQATEAAVRHLQHLHERSTP